MGKKQRKADEALACERPDREAQIIRLSVKYLQLLAANEAGFKADPTGDSVFASVGNHIGKAKRSLIKLVGLSPHAVPCAAPLSEHELRAKVAVARALYGFQSGEELESDELIYLRFVLGEVEDFFSAASASRRA
ncbi:hypothetical protein WN73_38475 [Bradyrhizobium sp. CCBAU 45394]|uniref:hypothetical protein n=1 Tax=Bradyrhizobium sp. CCBAU 45394 TaxID=1325087 RepID=UPI002304A374|nr:hypothetical protein [Bradyrhizobium sp. CCBAU 45394]MDA9396400.1 hypothetical protein [Bradyrhizobium sp. CCBAU 45394]